ncbi:MAG TPA: SGNH/GDSL hydrolase family protein [Mycobacteriales bacterium]|nr:SGNH/GDSL hydrolase family protein [Mycobacteriales bacterium]
MPGPIVFIGDSITDCDRRTDPLGLGGGYVDLATGLLRDRGDDSVVINSGVSGDRIEHLGLRWQADALDHAPAVLSIHIGVNDTLVAFYQGRPTPADLFEQRYRDVLDRTAAAGRPGLIILEPFFIGATSDSPWVEGNDFARADLDAKRPAVRDLATRYGAVFVPLQEAMDAAAAERGPAVVAPDGVHPSATGHLLIARLWLDAYDEVTGGPR